MKNMKPYPADAAALAALRNKLHSGISSADLVADLRGAGFDKIDSMKFLREFGSVSLHDAKDIVHLSPAWGDRYASDEAFHDIAEQAAEIIFQDERSVA